MFKEERIKKLIKHYKYVAKSNKTHPNELCTVEELNHAIDKTAELILQIFNELSD